jgi:hypothetical protein
MDDLTLELAESEIRLGFAFVQAGLSCLSRQDVKRLVEAWERAQASYLRARRHVLELSEGAKLHATVQLETLKTSIDELAAQTPAGSGNLQKLDETDMSHAPCFFVQASA